MTKYTRSATKLMALIKEVFGVCEISVDTKAIVLVLAGTLPSAKFKAWIDQIPCLYPLNMHFKQINLLRNEFGDNFRNYIMIKAMQAVDHDVSSDELQQFTVTTEMQVYEPYPQTFLFFNKIPFNAANKL